VVEKHVLLQRVAQGVQALVVHEILQQVVLVIHQALRHPKEIMVVQQAAAEVGQEAEAVAQALLEAMLLRNHVVDLVVQEQHQALLEHR
jgi:hypothetical protein